MAYYIRIISKYISHHCFCCDFLLIIIIKSVALVFLELVAGAGNRPNVFQPKEISFLVNKIGLDLFIFDDGVRLATHYTKKNVVA